MNYHRFKQKVFVPLIVVPAFLISAELSFAAQDTAVDTSIITEASAIASQAFDAAAESQMRINQLSDEADELIGKFREEAKAVDGLEVYNASYRSTIAQQESTIAGYDVAIGEAAELQRQVAPLMIRMMDALEQFVALDLPFQLELRNERLATVRGAFDRADVNVAEKFRAVLTAYQAESNYGRSLDAYTDVLAIDGVDRDVDILKVGRIALLYQTSDQSSTGVWNKSTGQWDVLGSEYIKPVREGIRMARGETQIVILDLPISAPE
jgi:hypothetical protein